MRYDRKEDIIHFSHFSNPWSFFTFQGFHLIFHLLKGVFAFLNLEEYSPNEWHSSTQHTASYMNVTLTFSLCSVFLLLCSSTTPSSSTMDLFLVSTYTQETFIPSQNLRSKWLITWKRLWKIQRKRRGHSEPFVTKTTLFLHWMKTFCATHLLQYETGI